MAHLAPVFIFGQGELNGNSLLSKVEVLKGPVSALYGSGSIGGVVNVITRKGYFTQTPQWNGETDLLTRIIPRVLAVTQTSLSTTRTTGYLPPEVTVTITVTKPATET